MCAKSAGKNGSRPRDPHGEIRAGILCRILVLKSKMVGWRPIWWQKGEIRCPLGFRAQPAYLRGRAAGGRAVARTLTPLAFTPPPLMQDKCGGSKWRDSGVLAGPGTPGDPKSQLFATKWVAIPPFGTLKPGSYAEFWPGSRCRGPGA